MRDRPSWMPLPPPAARKRSGTPAPVQRERSAPSLASDGARARMIDALRGFGVRDPTVLDAMAQVPRHAFVDAALASRGYEDVALPIGHGQTISRPTTVARMVELAVEPLAPARRASARVLEVGTGCGYQAAVLARVFGEAVSVERVRWLHEQARANLRTMRLPNLRLVFGDGNLGVPQAAPFDAIVVAAAGDSIPEALLEQMRIGARLVAPVGSTRQSLHLVERVERDRWQLTILDAVRFVPLRTGTV
ncbi:MAG TPA: protein-L-isoaspartate(D-aspartate) O-methyltransferase [Zeimonas sp.]